MSRSPLSFLRIRSLMLCLLWSLSPLFPKARLAKAQIIPDDTLGASTSQLIPNQDIAGVVVNIIQGGSSQGRNLFHSFSEFNIAEGQQVYFANPVGVESILSRVTGSNPSEILGTLGVAGNADLFLVNPNGLFFGETAQLDVAGSFHATTADGIELGSGVFSAVAPEQSQLLSVSPSVSFMNYLSESSGNIVSQGQLTTGGDLSLSGNSLYIQGVVATGSGDLSLLAADTVQIKDTQDISFFIATLDDLLIQGNHEIDINASNNPLSRLFSFGNINLRSVGSENGNAPPNNGTISIIGRDFTEIGGTVDDVFAIGTTDGSRIHIDARSDVSILNSPIFTAGSRDVGDIKINTDGTVQIKGPNAVLSSELIEGEVGAGGDISITAANLEVSGGARLLTRNFGMGTAGNVILNVEGTARFDGTNSLVDNPTGISSRLQPDAVGAGGDIRINSRHLEILNNAALDTTTSGKGNAGNVILNIEETARFEDGLLFSSVTQTGRGTGGDIIVNARNLAVIDRALIGASSSGEGNSGNVTLSIRETARFKRGAALSSILLGGLGKGGNVQLSSANAYLTEGADLAAASLGQGDAGNLILDIQNRLEIAEGTLSTQSQSDSGGQIQINAGDIFLFNDSDIQTFVNSGENQAGNITIVADFLIALDDSDILAFSVDGRGGDIDLSQSIFLGENFTPTSSGTVPETFDTNNRVDINASGVLSSGEILVNDANFLEKDLIELPDNLLVPETLLAGSCVARNRNRTGTFTVSRYDALPQTPHSLVMPSYSTNSVQNIPSNVADTDPMTAIEEAQAIYQLPDGRLMASRNCSNQ